MATKPNYGKGRNLRLIAFDEADEAALILAVNTWFEGLEEEEIVHISHEVESYGTPIVEHLHCFIIYTEE